MKRNIYDKSCYNAVNGQMGRLQTVFRLPVLPNDTVSINLVGAFRLAQLRKWLTLDCLVHVAFYFVKHRWCYSNWDTFIKNSLSSERASATSLATSSLTGTQDSYDIFGISHFNPGNVPQHIVKGYWKIWNRWYRIPNVTDEVTDTTVPSTIVVKKYGARTARLPNFWNTGVPTGRLDADPTVFTESGSGSFSLVDIAKIQAEYQDDLDRDWFAHRYRDIIASKWGSTGITNEVDDDQAELLYDQNVWTSGENIHNTDGTNVGKYVGKSTALIHAQMPPRYFNESGDIWCVMTPRFPSICENEKHYLDDATLTADNFLGLPEVARSTPPVEITEPDVFWNEAADSGSYGKIPYLNWYRFQPNRVTKDFHDAQGFPFVRHGDLTGADFDDIAYHGSTTDAFYGDNRFFMSTTELSHWNMVSKAEIEVRSVLPKASESIYAGATHIN